MEFPQKWANIRERLLELKGSKKPFIEKDEYYNLCRDCGENSPDIAKWLLSWFNDLGVCFSYHQDRDTNKELESYQLLAPNWIINAMYTIINNSKGLSKNGIILHENIKDILKKGSASLNRSLMREANYEDRTDYILNVMRKFRLSQDISDDIYDTKEEFIPALCENNTPADLHPKAWVKHVTYKYVYQFLPDNVVHQMMLFRKQKGHQEPTKLWLKGFRLDFDDEGTAFVFDMGNDDNILLINVYSLLDDSSPYKQFKKIQENINEINKRLGLSPYECISVEANGIKQDLPIIPLSKMLNEGKRTCTIFDQENYAEIKLRDMLEGIISIAPDELGKIGMRARATLDRENYAEIKLHDVLAGIIYPDESRKADRLNDSTGKEEMKTEAEKAPGNAGGGVTNNTFIFGGVHPQGDSIIGSGSTVNNGLPGEQITELVKAVLAHKDKLTDERMAELFKAMNEHNERITEEVLDTIATMVVEQSKQQSEQQVANALQAFAAGLKESSTKEPPIGKLQKRYKDFKESNPMLVDAAGLIKTTIFSAVIPHFPEIAEWVKSWIK